jgi:hypothetical protein
MLFAPLFGAALVVAVATEPLNDAGVPSTQTHISLQEKLAATEPLVRSATDCIVHAVTADPRYGAGKQAPPLGDLIVA